MASKDPRQDPDWIRRDRVLRGLPPVPASQENEAGVIRDQPTEDGGPVRGPEDKPFERDPELVEADHTIYPSGEESEKKR